MLQWEVIGMIIVIVVILVTFLVAVTKFLGKTT